MSRAIGVGEHARCAAGRPRAGSGWDRPSPDTGAKAPSGTRPAGVSTSRSNKAPRRAVGVREAQHHIEAAVAIDDLRDDAPVGQQLQRLGRLSPASGRRAWRHARSRRATCSCGMRTCFSTCRSTRPLIGARRFSQVGSARPRRVSRSSPKILMTICARTPESMWSSRCEMGCPTLTRTGSTERRARISASTCSRLRRDGFRSTSISRTVHAFGMLIEFGPAGAATDCLHLRHLADQALGNVCRPGPIPRARCRGCSSMLTSEACPR